MGKWYARLRTFGTHHCPIVLDKSTTFSAVARSSLADVSRISRATSSGRFCISLALRVCEDMSASRTVEVGQYYVQPWSCCVLTLFQIYERGRPFLQAAKMSARSVTRFVICCPWLLQVNVRWRCKDLPSALGMWSRSRRDAFSDRQIRTSFQPSLS